MASSPSTHTLVLLLSLPLTHAPPAPPQAAGRAVFRNAFTSGSMGRNPFFNPFDLAFKNIANTCVLHWNSKLYALWEVGLVCGRGGSAPPMTCVPHWNSKLYAPWEVGLSRFPPQTCIIRGWSDGSYLPLWKPASH